MRIFGRATPESSGAETSQAPVSRALAVSADRIRRIVDAAEVAAADIRVEADSLRGGEPSDESRISRERLVADLADALVARADELSRDAKDLADVLNRARNRLDPSPPPEFAEPAASAEAPDSASLEPAPSPVQALMGRRTKTSELQEKVADRFVNATEAAESSEGHRVPFKRRSSAEPRYGTRTAPSADGLRLLATQMAVAGSSREEIEERLRDEFQISDTSTVLGDVGTSRVESQGRNG